MHTVLIAVYCLVLIAIHVLAVRDRIRIRNDKEFLLEKWEETNKIAKDTIESWQKSEEEWQMIVLNMCGECELRRDRNE